MASYNKLPIIYLQLDIFCFDRVFESLAAPNPPINRQSGTDTVQISTVKIDCEMGGVESQSIGS